MRPRPFYILGGYVPGCLIGIALMVFSVLHARKNNIQDKVGFHPGRLGRTFAGALGAIICPVIVLGGILSGVFTATEAGIIACLHAVSCGAVVYRRLTGKKFFTAVYDACKTTGMVMMLLSTAAIHGCMFARAQVGTQLLSLMLKHVVVMVLIIFIPGVVTAVPNFFYA